MGFLIFFHYIIILIVLISIHAPWWAWIIHVGSVLFWLVIGVLSNDETDALTQNKRG